MYKPFSILCNPFAPSFIEKDVETDLINDFKNTFYNMVQNVVGRELVYRIIAKVETKKSFLSNLKNIVAIIRNNSVIIDHQVCKDNKITTGKYMQINENTRDQLKQLITKLKTLYDYEMFGDAKNKCNFNKNIITSLFNQITKSYEFKESNIEKIEKYINNDKENRLLQIRLSHSICQNEYNPTDIKLTISSDSTKTELITNKRCSQDNNFVELQTSIIGGDVVLFHELLHYMHNTLEHRHIYLIDNNNKSLLNIIMNDCIIKQNSQNNNVFNCIWSTTEELATISGIYYTKNNNSETIVYDFINQSSYQIASSKNIYDIRYGHKYPNHAAPNNFFEACMRSYIAAINL